MKRTAIYLTALAIVPMMISSCRVYDSKEYMEEPAYLLAQAAYKNFVNPLLKSAELADFFARYQEIRSDREAALALADTYFPGGWGISELYYEMAAGYYGDIYLEDDGSFLVIPTWGMYYLSCSGVLSCDIYDIGFSVVPEGDRRYSISSVTIPDSYDYGASGSEAVISATVSCDDENIVLEECLIELPECTVTSVDGAPAVVASDDVTEYSPAWKDRVLRNGSLEVVTFPVDRTRPGHTLTLVCGDPGIMFQRIIVDWGGLKPTYVGPSVDCATRNNKS